MCEPKDISTEDIKTVVFHEGLEERVEPLKTGQMAEKARLGKARVIRQPADLGSRVRPCPFMTT